MSKIESAPAVPLEYYQGRLNEYNDLPYSEQLLRIPRVLAVLYEPQPNPADTNVLVVYPKSYKNKKEERPQLRPEFVLGNIRSDETIVDAFFAAIDRKAALGPQDIQQDHMIGLSDSGLEDVSLYPITAPIVGKPAMYLSGELAAASWLSVDELRHTFAQANHHSSRPFRSQIVCDHLYHYVTESS